jgi:hypothetical protein
VNKSFARDVFLQHNYKNATVLTTYAVHRSEREINKKTRDLTRMQNEGKN